MKTIPNQAEIQDFLHNGVFTSPNYAIYLSSIVDRVAAHFEVSKEDRKILSKGHRYCRDKANMHIKPTGSVLEQQVEFSLRKMQQKGTVVLIGQNFWKAGA